MDKKKVALIGNPNTGKSSLFNLMSKSSLFNLMTGLRQHVGNFPGVTVDKKTGTMLLDRQHSVSVIDLPGTYSVFPRSRDEKVVSDIITNPKDEHFPDVFVVVVDVSNLERNLLLYSQLHDMGLPMIVALTMHDLTQRNDWVIDQKLLSSRLDNVPVVAINGRTGEGLKELKAAIKQFNPSEKTFEFSSKSYNELAHNEELQTSDATVRYEKIRSLVKDVIKKKEKRTVHGFTTKADKILVHPLWGYLIFLFVLLVIFQFIDSFASVPMDWIDQGFGDRPRLWLAQWLGSQHDARRRLHRFNNSRYHSRYWRRGHIHSTNRIALFLSFSFGRNRLHVACGLHHGQTRSSVWIKWQKRCAFDEQCCLCHSRYYGCKEYWKLEG